jgi:glycosyltransferase involved in cell wall biosynthesis
MAPKLTIGMANWDDPEGAWWTLCDIRLHHVKRERTDVELLVVDDMPDKQQDLENACNNAGARYVHHSKNKGPAHAKDSVWEHAKGDYVLLLDSHVLLAPCSVQYIIDAIDSDLIGKDLWTGPLLNESGGTIATELLPEWRGDFFGIWFTDPELPKIKIKEIEGHGSAYTLMKREHYPYFSKHFSGFSGEELYLHQKVRNNGGKCYTHQELGWIHRFMRSKPITYSLTLNDKLRNYLVASYEIGWSIKQCCDYFKPKLAKDQFDNVLSDVKDVFPNINFEDDSGKRHKVHD